MRGTAEHWATEARVEMMHLMDSKNSFRQPWQWWSILSSAVLSLMVFFWVYWVSGFAPRFYTFRKMQINLCLSIILCVLFTARAIKKFRHHPGHHHPRGVKAPITFAVSLWAAVITAYVLADKSYWKYMHNYYSIKDMGTYINVDPGNDKGQTFMDAGQVYFKESTTVAVGKAVAFQNNAIYCAAPILSDVLENQGGSQKVQQDGALSLPASGTVDFWAVGINCCEPSGLGFKCGEVHNGNARAGIRMLRDDVRPLYLLAVQEWAAELKIPSRHPLFFYWVQDPVKEVDGYWWQAQYEWLMSSACFFLGVIILVMAVQYFLYVEGYN